MGSFATECLTDRALWTGAPYWGEIHQYFFHENRYFLPNLFLQLEEDFFVIFLINGLNLSYLFTHNNTSDLDKILSFPSVLTWIFALISFLDMCQTGKFMFHHHMWRHLSATRVPLWTVPWYQSKRSFGCPFGPKWRFSGLWYCSPCRRTSECSDIGLSA